MRATCPSVTAAQVTQLQLFLDAWLTFQVEDLQLNGRIGLLPVDQDGAEIYLVIGFGHVSILVDRGRAATVRLIEAAGGNVIEWISGWTREACYFGPVSITTNHQYSVGLGLLD